MPPKKRGSTKPKPQGGGRVASPAVQAAKERSISPVAAGSATASPNKSAVAARRPATRRNSPTPRLSASCATWLKLIAVLLSCIGIAVYVIVIGGSPDEGGSPCPCAVQHHHSNRLASALLGGPRRINGLHLRHSSNRLRASLSFMKDCKGAVVYAAKTYTSIEELWSDLQAPFAQQRRCVVWVVALEQIKAIGNALKELIENNALGGAQVVPNGSRGLFLLTSDASREALKDILPHRVVHMLTTVDLD